MTNRRNAVEIATLQDYLESLRPFTGVAWVSQTAAKFAANSYWATQNYRAVTGCFNDEMPTVSVMLNDEYHEGNVQVLGDTCMIVKVFRGTVSYIIVLERVPMGAGVLQALSRDWSLAAAGVTTLFGSTSSDVHVASKLLLDPEFSLRPKQ